MPTTTTSSTTNNSAKEPEEPIVTNKTPTTPQKSTSTEEAPKTTESPQAKPKPQTSPVKEHNAAIGVTSTPPKAEPKVTISPRTNKRKLKETSEGRAQGLDNSSKSKRRRRRTEPFQSPLPELAIIVKNLSKPSASKAQDDKLIVFYKYVEI